MSNNMEEETKEIVVDINNSMSLDDAPQVEQTLRLIASLGEKFEIPRKTALQSQLVKTMVEGDKDETDIPLPNVTSSLLTKICEYLRYHVDKPAKEIEKPLKSSIMEEIVGQWDADFVNVDQEVLFEIILAANYMDIKPLLDLGCAKVASMIKGKTPEQIRKTFNIDNDFTFEQLSHTFGCSKPHIEILTKFVFVFHQSRRRSCYCC